MGFFGRIKKAVKHQVRTVEKVAKEPLKIQKKATQFTEKVAKAPIKAVKSITGAFKGLGGSGAGGDQSYTSPAMADVARSRAAGSGTVNFTDRTPGGK